MKTRKCNSTAYITILKPFSITPFPKLFTGLPHTQGIQGTSVNFQVEENLRETQGSFDFFLKIQGSFKN